jgi:hypothetical protein
MNWRAKGQERSDRGPETHQSVRPQSGGFAVQLAIQTQNRAQKQRGPEAQNRLFISGKHGLALSRSSAARRKSFYLRVCLAAPIPIGRM